MLSTLQTPRLLLPLPTRLSIRCCCLSSLPVTQLPITAQSSPPTSQILSIRHSLLTHQTTALQLAQSHLSHLQSTEPHIKSFLHVSNTILKEAEETDKKISKNEPIGVLAGVFVGVKDNICTANMPSTAGSRVLEGYVPPYDATVVRKVKEGGGILVGKTNLDEFGMGSTTERSSFQVYVQFVWKDLIVII